MNYLSVDVFKNRGTDCSNNGISKTCPEHLVVPCEEGNLTEEDVKEYGYTKLSLVDRGPDIRDNFIEDGETRWSMFGGTFIWTSDSRFSRKYGSNPIPLHDRIED